MAEVLLQQAFERAGLAVVVDSVGVSDEEQGNPMDRRARRVLRDHGYPDKPQHAARQVRRADLVSADLVLPMTAQHAARLRRVAADIRFAGDITGSDKIRLYRTFDPSAPAATGRIEYLLDVADPWYGGAADFEECLAELEAGVPGIVEFVRAELGQ